MRISFGDGGTILRNARSALATQQRAGKIKAFVSGEESSPFYANARMAVASLSRDMDSTSLDHRITLVLL